VDGTRKKITISRERLKGCNEHDTNTRSNKNERICQKQDQLIMEQVAQIQNLMFAKKYPACYSTNKQSLSGQANKRPSTDNKSLMETSFRKPCTMKETS
jgi:hypothetical protein